VRNLLAGLAVLPVLTSAALAAPLKGRLVAEGDKDADLAGYVVWIEGGEKLDPVAVESSTPAMNQLHKHFSPPIVAIRAGSGVQFENMDEVFHNVFSLDKRNPFDLGMFKGKKRFAADGKKQEGEGVPTQTFPKAGKFLVFCNIHPDMMGTVHVFDHGYFSQSDKDGLFSLPELKAGDYSLVVDGPRLAEPFHFKLTAPASGLVDVSLKLKRRAAVAAHSRKNGEDYPDPEKSNPY
jgi:plastocyanin